MHYVNNASNRFDFSINKVMRAVAIRGLQKTIWKYQGFSLSKNDNPQKIWSIEICKNNDETYEMCDVTSMDYV